LPEIPRLFPGGGPKAKQKKNNPKEKLVRYLLPAENGMCKRSRVQVYRPSFPLAALAGQQEWERTNEMMPVTVNPPQ